MNEYIYTAKDQDGKLIKARVEAASPSDAAKLLISQDLFPIDITLPSEAGIQERLKEYTQDVRPVKAKDRVIFTRQLSTLIKAGLPLAKSLEILVSQIDNVKLQRIVEDISNSVQGGTTLSKSLSKHPNEFDSIYISMVEAGETGGNLDDTLLRLAEQEEKNQKIRSKVRSALTYPFVVFVVIIAVTVLMLTMVIPQVSDMYIELNEPMPLMTEILQAISDFMINYWYVILLGLAGLVYGGRAYFKTDKGKAQYDNVKLNAPGIKIIVRKVYMARFTRTMSSLINSGVSVLQALHITARSINNTHLESAIENIAERVKAGDPISKPISNNHLFLPLVGQMIQVGEQTGSVGDSMEKVASYYEDEVDNAMENISTLIEPATMVVLGGIVAFLIGAVLLPIYGLVSSIQ